MSDMSNEVSAIEAAEILGLSKVRVCKMCAAGTLKAKKVGNSWVIDRDSVEERKASSPSVGRPRKAPEPVDEEGPVYEVQQISFDEFSRDNLTGEMKFQTVFRSRDAKEALRYWQSYASGVNDYEGPFENQNLSRAHFFRIVEKEA